MEKVRLKLNQSQAAANKLSIVALESENYEPLY